ncbi:sigma-70 family RNA polymerase sigma factor [Actinomadura sp. 3N407]|uniref:sigma-70 family RNA polymerase sigma factor n=1 Tax=Actinomadura sp. 3N407 TaxID=3457423 RepID=UPI003FCEE618
MDIMEQIDGARPGADDFRTRNRRLFTRRKELREKLTELRIALGSDGPAARREPALGRAERELDDVTNEIINLNLGLVRKYVAMFTSRSSAHTEDFESAGKVGLLWAISSYDPDRGPFASWAFKPIQREVLRAVRDADHPNLNPGDFEKRPAILAAERAYLEAAGPDAPVDHADVARRAGVTEAQVRRVLTPPRLEALHPPVAAHGEDDGVWEEQLADPSPSAEEKVLLSFDLCAVGRDLLKLDPRELYVLTRRFGLDGEPEQSLRVIGERLRLSREGVRQIEQKSLAKLAEAIADTSADAPGGLRGRAG